MDNAKLEKKWPKLTVRNRTNEQKHIEYADTNGDGLPDSVTINPGATRHIPSKGLLQVPSILDFELVEPTLFELQQAGVVQLGEQKKAQATSFGEAAEKTVADSAAESGVTANANQRQTVETESTNPDAGVAQRPIGTIPATEGGRNATPQGSPRNRR